MLLYTIIPLEIIFDEEDEKHALVESPKEIEIKNGQTSIMCQQLPSGEMRVNRIISTNPQDYLNPHWQPGAIMRK